MEGLIAKILGLRGENQHCLKILVSVNKFGYRAIKFGCLCQWSITTSIRFKAFVLIMDEAKKIMTYSDFSRWSVENLKEFLRKRDIKRSGVKIELVAKAYAAYEMGVEEKPVGEELHAMKASEYRDLLLTEEGYLPDPYDLSGWLSEKEGIYLWPPTMYFDISDFLSDKAPGDMDLKKRLMTDYKEGKAYSYFSSGWLKEIFYHPISDTSKFSFLKAECTPSQKIRNIPHKTWVCLHKNTGKVQSAHCSCMAG